MEAAIPNRPHCDAHPKRVDQVLPEVGLVQRSQNVSVELVPHGALPHRQLELKIPAVSIMLAFEAGSAWEAVATTKLNKRSFRNRFHFMPAQTEMHVRHEAPPPEFLLLGIDTGFAHRVFEEVFERGGSDPHPIIGEAHARLLSLGTLIRGDLLRRRQLKPLELESLATLVLGEWSDVAALKQPDGVNHKMLVTVEDFIEAHLHQDLSLIELAAAAGLSPSYFLRSFKQATGQTPHRFVMERRVRRAREHLERTDRPLAEIAYECGFASQSHMSDVFRHHLNMSPGRYRRSMRS